MSTCRYLARALLVVFPNKPPPLKLGSLESVLKSAPAAFPELLKSGNNKIKKLKEIVEPFSNSIVKEIDGLDFRIATQYAVLIAFTQQVCFNCLYILLYL